MMKVIIVESEFSAIQDTARVGSAVERLADALSQQNIYRRKSVSLR